MHHIPFIMKLLFPFFRRTLYPILYFLPLVFTISDVPGSYAFQARDLRNGTIVIPKAGLGWANADMVDMRQFTSTGNVSWYYTWSAFPTEADIEFVPMFWGNKSFDQFNSTMQQVLFNNVNNVTTLLGMNEPDIPSQANVTPEQGVEMWLTYVQPPKSRAGERRHTGRQHIPGRLQRRERVVSLRRRHKEIVVPVPVPVLARCARRRALHKRRRRGNGYIKVPALGIANHSRHSPLFAIAFHDQGLRLGSPAPSSSPAGKAWLHEFLTTCGNNCTVDFIAIHWYGTNASQFITYLEDFNATFEKPLWVTEWACQNYVDLSAQCSFNDVEEFLNITQTYMNQADFVERYAWFGAMKDLQGLNKDNALIDDNGKINDLGRQYIGTSQMNVGFVSVAAFSLKSPFPPVIFVVIFVVSMLLSV